MKSFMENIPEQYHQALREAIEAITESKYMLDQVTDRFGTRDPVVLRGMLGETFDGITVTEEAVAELEALTALHEEKREACRRLLDAAAKGITLDTVLDEA